MFEWKYQITLPVFWVHANNIVSISCLVLCLLPRSHFRKSDISVCLSLCLSVDYRIENFCLQSISHQHTCFTIKNWSLTFLVGAKQNFDINWGRWESAGKKVYFVMWDPLQDTICIFVGKSWLKRKKTQFISLDCRVRTLMFNMRYQQNHFFYFQQ